MRMESVQMAERGERRSEGLQGWPAFIVLLVGLLATASAEATPAYGRRYSVSCNTYHSPDNGVDCLRVGSERFPRVPGDVGGDALCRRDDVFEVDTRVARQGRPPPGSRNADAASPCPRGPDRPCGRGFSRGTT